MAVIQGSQQLSREEKRARLSMLHVQHQSAMNDLRLSRLAAHEAAKRQAIAELAADEATPSALRADIYQRALEDAMAKDVPALFRSFEVAELIGNGLGMRAAAVAALLRRSPVPGDAATKLVARFAGAQESDGHGGQRHRHPKASAAWERLSELDAWTDRDHVEAAAAFSVAAHPTPAGPSPAATVTGRRSQSRRRSPVLPGQRPVSRHHRGRQWPSASRGVRTRRPEPRACTAATVCSLPAA